MIITILYNFCALIVVKELLKENYDILYIDVKSPFYKNLLITVLHKCLYYYSKLQILMNTTVYPLVQKYANKPNYPIVPSIELYKDGEFILKQNYKEQTNLPVYNYVIFSQPSGNIVNKVIYTDIPSDLSYDVSNIKFVSINLEYNNTIYDMDFHKSDYNYYVVNNKIDNMFIMYYLKYVIQNEVNESLEDFTYKLTIMDNNINIIQLDETDTLVITKDNYIVQQKEQKKNKKTIKII